MDGLQCTEFYKQEAQKYDQRRFDCHCSRFQDELYKKTVFSFIPRDGKIMLDAGTGTGRFAVYFAKRGKSVVAMDYSFEMLNQTLAKIRRNNLQNRIFLVQGDIRNLPFKSDAFSAINSIHVLVHFPRVDDVFAELSRILKPGGVFVTELASRLLLKTFYRMRKAFTGKPFSFADYFRTLSEMKKIAGRNGLYLSASKGIKKIPRFIVHPFTCIYGHEKLLRQIARLEAYNFGVVKIVRMVKNGN